MEGALPHTRGRGLEPHTRGGGTPPYIAKVSGVLTRKAREPKRILRCFVVRRTFWVYQLSLSKPPKHGKLPLQVFQQTHTEAPVSYTHLTLPTNREV